MTDDLRTAGKRLRSRVLELMPGAGLDHFTSIEMARDGVTYVTLRHWFEGETRPRGKELGKLARLLNTTLDDLDAAYEGRPRADDPYRENLELMARLDRLTEELHRLASVQELLLPDAARATLEGLRDAEAEAHPEVEDQPDEPPGEPQ